MLCPREECSGEKCGCGVQWDHTHHVRNCTSNNFVDPSVLQVHLTTTQVLLTSCENSVLWKLSLRKGCFISNTYSMDEKPEANNGEEFSRSTWQLVFFWQLFPALVHVLLYHHQKAVCFSFATVTKASETLCTDLKNAFESNFTPNNYLVLHVRQCVFEVMELFVSLNIQFSERVLFIPLEDNYRKHYV